MTSETSDIAFRRTKAENAAWVVYRLRDLGLNPNASSRFVRMQRILARGYIPYDHPDFWIALESDCDMNQLAFILEQPMARRDNVRFMNLLSRCLDDDPLPQNYGKKMESAGRDAQFELYMAAICENAGLRPVDLCEPDVTCVLNGTTIGLAAKRLKKLDRVRNEVKDAANQIFKSGHSGVITLEISLARNPANRPIVSSTPDDWYDAIYQQRCDGFFDTYANDLRKWVKGKHVLVIVVFESMKRLRNDGQWGLDGMAHWLPTTASEARAHNLFNAFQPAFIKGMINVNAPPTR